ncbi:hypothetical protein OCK74_25270 [Chitinophagaceae bacterium LB-8]|uniref:Outer membrane protein beta-barrel domain-containing protein n=1 Tax=Paraflavisolibacter caeni TaxID=2982496 RepID=A0A9X3B9T7_9BACT|nr:hypothetical protein [Paraflavisolibacter caeni]MCU7552455.1 hypothetical protein [Paraflavisolibacter caeni]
MRKIFLISSILLYISAAAQYSFHSINQLGIVEGEKGTSFQLQTINGFTRNYWFAGVGAGLDYYHQRTVPVFIDIRRKILKNEKSPFVYADAGFSFPWEKQDGESVWYKEEYKKGSYFDLGLGYQLPVHKLGSFVFSLGYSEKRLREERYNDFYLIYSGVYDGGNNKNIMDYRFRRISIKAGWQF